MSSDSGNIQRSPPKPLWIFLYLAIALAYLFAVARFWDEEQGFTELIHFGDQFSEASLPTQHGIPHHVVPHNSGYDGQFYAQIALDPSLQDPRLEDAVDTLPYRARRIGLPFISWVAGLGSPVAVLNAYALLNPLCWLISAGLLLRWLPPTGIQNFIRWAGFLYGYGMIVSTRYALTDGPAICLTIAAITLYEKRKTFSSAALIALSILVKETQLLAGSLFLTKSHLRSNNWLRLTGIGALLILPLSLWLAYIHFTILPGSQGEITGGRNFTYPFLGYIRKWQEVFVYLADYHSWRTSLLMLLSHIATSIFLVFLFIKPDFSSPWWRTAIPFALLGIFLGDAVWETYPGATCRVLIATHLAFNILAPRSKLWLTLVIIANLAAINMPRTMRTAEDLPPPNHQQLQQLP